MNRIILSLKKSQNWWNERTMLEQKLLLFMVIYFPLIKLVFDSNFLHDSIFYFMLSLMNMAPTLAITGLGYFACALAYKIIVSTYRS
jgi:hypothetical protein